MHFLKQTPRFCMLLLFLSTQSIAQTLEEGSPGLVRVSAERLNRIDSLLQNGINNNWINGAVGLIARDGKIIYKKAFGLDDVSTGKAMSTDAIFRIASQTKAITSVGVMILYEEGKIGLDDAISKYIPAFKNPTVIAQYNAADTTYTTVPARREITIRDLLTHTSGIDYAVIGSNRMKAIYAKSGIPVGFEHRALNLGEQINKLAKLPLTHQPGERYTYGLSVDVLGYLIEVVSGKTLDQFLRERIFNPLAMNDTYFFIPPAKQSKLVSLYTENSQRNLVKWESYNGISADYPKLQGTYYSGGAGLSSTISDYATFLQMVLNGGEYNGKRILKKTSVDQMIVNQIGDLNRGANKFGLGFEIISAATQARNGVSEGSFRWGGYFGTTYWGDPKERIIGLLFFQQSPLRHGELQDQFHSLVYKALEK